MGGVGGIAGTAGTAAARPQLSRTNSNYLSYPIYGVSIVSKRTLPTRVCVPAAPIHPRRYHAVSAVALCHRALRERGFVVWASVGLTWCTFPILNDIFELRNWHTNRCTGQAADAGIGRMVHDVPYRARDAIVTFSWAQTNRVVRLPGGDPCVRNVGRVQLKIFLFPRPRWRAWLDGLPSLGALDPLLIVARAEVHQVHGLTLILGAAVRYSGRPGRFHLFLFRGRKKIVDGPKGEGRGKPQKIESTGSSFGVIAFFQLLCLTVGLLEGRLGDSISCFCGNIPHLGWLFEGLD